MRLYADDTTVLLRNLPSLASLHDCINIYEKGFGAKLNRSKSEAMWLGAWRSRPDEPFGLTWVAKIKKKKGKGHFYLTSVVPSVPTRLLSMEADGAPSTPPATVSAPFYRYSKL